MGRNIASFTPYEIRHLAHHLEASGRVNDLFRLLSLEIKKNSSSDPLRVPAIRSETEQSQKPDSLSGVWVNFWYDIKEQAGDSAGFFNDVARALRLAEEAYSPNDLLQAGHNIGLQCRFILILASINSIAESIHPKSLNTYVERGEWTPEQGLFYTKLKTNAGNFLETLKLLSSSLSGSHIEEVLLRILEIEDDEIRAEALKTISKRLPHGRLRQILRELLDVIDLESHALTIAVLLGQLAEWGYQREVLTCLQSIEDIEAQYDISRSLLPKLAELGYTNEALETAQMIPSDGLRAGVLAELTPLLPKYMLNQVLAAVRQMKNGAHQETVLEALAPCLPESLMEDSIQIALKIKDESPRAWALKDLAPYLTESLLEKACLAAQEIKNGEERADLLAEIAPRVADFGHSEEALEVANRIANLQKRYATIQSITLRLANSGCHDAASTVIKYIKDEKIYKDTEEQLAEIKRSSRPPVKSVDEQEEADWSQTNEQVAVQKIGDEKARAKALSALADYLDKMRKGQQHKFQCGNRRLIQEDISAALRGYKDYAQRVAALIGLAKHWPDPESEKTIRDSLLSVIESIEDKRKRIEALIQLIPILTSPTRERIFREILIALPPRFGEAVLYKSLKIAQLVLEESNYSLRFIEVLSRIKSRLKGFDELECWRAQTIKAISPFLQAHQAREALIAVRRIRNEELRVDALLDLAPFLPTTNQRKAKNYTKAIKNRYKKVLLLAKLGYIDEALAEAHAIGQERVDQSALFMAFADPHLARDMIRKIQERDLAEVKALAGVALYLPDSLKDNVAQEALKKSRGIKDVATRSEALLSVAPSLPKALRWKAAQEALSAANAIGKEERLKDSSSSSRYIVQQEKRDKALAALTLQFANLGYPNKALQIVNLISSNYDRLRNDTVMMLSRKLVEVGDQELALSAALLLPQIGRKDWMGRSQRSVFLMELVSLITKTGHFQFALKAAASIPDERTRHLELNASAQLISLISLETIYPMWRSILRHQQSRIRKDVLLDIIALLPVLSALGGIEAINEASRAIHDVGRWWP